MDVNSIFLFTTPKDVLPHNLVIDKIDHSKELTDEILERELLISLAIDSLENTTLMINEDSRTKLLTILEICPPIHWPLYIVKSLQRTSDEQFWKEHPYFSDKT